MIRDEFGICLSQEMLKKNLSSTFTHVRAYEIEKPDNESVDDAQVLLSYPQMTGEDVLISQKKNATLAWRAEHFCPSFK
ncbi:hypothetical protein [Vibrio salinus]|uniref:hypothetical protein n=1 Tax=Vibrio salinus TaxID=2899784 RepID=UPI001E3586D2|nr:hypothetical protein [Vibrio salinus]MCE0492404.1 hypothetical protein [Vibrio salinus]